MAKEIRKGNLKPQKVADGEKDFAAVLEIITTHRSRALMSVNVESLLTYWEIGAFLSPRIHSGSWSRAIVGKLAEYIKRNQPELRGYGKSNLYNMARVYDVFSSSGFLDLMQRHQDKLPSPQDIFQSATGKSDEEMFGDNIFQLATGKCLPPVLCLTTFTNLVLIASCCNIEEDA